MNTLFPVTALIASGGLLSWLLRKKPQISAVAGCGSLCGGSAAAMFFIFRGFFSGGGFSPADLFLLPILILAFAAALHSPGYLAGHGSERSGTYWFLFNLTAAAMVSVTRAETPLGFLIAWEIMGAASFGLVIFDRRNCEAFRAGWIYMIACHAGAVFLMLLFFFPHTPLWIFILALIGFGLKIGFPLLHVWLPEAHPAAPAPVSALMSGAMIALGFYGLFTYGIIRENMLYAAWTLTVLGIATAITGIIFALAQSNIKKLLAYSSIENMGIFSCAAGLGILGLCYDLPFMAAGGLAGAGIHLLNHSLLKGGLFLAAGSVYKASGTLDMDKLGGLFKKMPLTGGLFFLNGISLCGLPPFNGFAGEFLIYCSAFAGVTSGNTAITAISTAILMILALTGGLAAAAFAKAIGGIFCGGSRSKNASDTVEVPFSMNLPILLLFFLSCVLLFCTPYIIEYSMLSIFPGTLIADTVPFLSGCAASVCAVSVLTALLTGLFVIIRAVLVRRSGERVSATWDCGYSRPDTKMEYTSSSLSDTMVSYFRAILRPERKIAKPEKIFPEKSSYSETIPDGGLRYFWEKIFDFIGKTADMIHRLQSGNLQFYLLIMFLTLAALLVSAVISGD